MSFKWSTLSNPNIIPTVDDPEFRMRRTNELKESTFHVARETNKTLAKRPGSWVHEPKLWKTVTTRMATVWIRTLR